MYSRGEGLIRETHTFVQFLLPSRLLAVVLCGCKVQSEEIRRSVRTQVEFLVTTGLLHSPRIVLIPLAEEGRGEREGGKNVDTSEGRERSSHTHAHMHTQPLPRNTH